MALSEQQIESRVVELVNLPTLPGILKKISKMTENRETSAADVAEVISVMRVHSAPLIGATAAYNLALTAQQAVDDDALHAAGMQLIATQPTAVNLH